MSDPGPGIVAEFESRFGTQPYLVKAPGRINLMGEHVDYNDGLVLPAAIDRHLLFAITPSGSDLCRFRAYDLDDEASFSIQELKPGKSWVNYLMGVLQAFRNRKLIVKGVNCVFGGTIPSGAGMSSSAAMCTGFAFALNELYNTGLSKVELARMAQFSENEFAGVMCGIMDQYASLMGKKDSALLLDCRELTHEAVPFRSSAYRLMMIDTRVKHSLASSEYNQRRASCEEGVRVLRKKHPEVRSLRDATRPMVDAQKGAMGNENWKRCRFVVEEIGRAADAAARLKEGDFDRFGALMYDAHRGLSEQFEVSCAELDSLVAMAASRKKDVIGSRMMGGGFGGCTINLIRPEAESSFQEMVRREYFAAFSVEPDFYDVSISDGTRQVNNDSVKHAKP